MIIINPDVRDQMLGVIPRSLWLTLLSIDYRTLAEPRVVHFMEPSRGRMAALDLPYNFTILQTGQLQWLELRDLDLRFVARSTPDIRVALTAGDTFMLRDYNFGLE